MKRRPRRKRKALDIILAVICASSLAAAALIGWTILHEGAVYSEISAEAGSAEGGGIDWEALRARNPDISAWVSVEGTPIDYPVVSPREGDPKGFYLNHDFDRNWSFAGMPLPRPAWYGRRAACARLRAPPQLRQRDVHLPEGRMAAGEVRYARRHALVDAGRGHRAPPPGILAVGRQELCRHPEVRPRRRRRDAGMAREPLGARRARGRRGATTCASTPRAPSRS